MQKIKVFLNTHDEQLDVIGKKEVEAELIQKTKKGFWVKLSDGNTIFRKPHQIVESND